MFFPGVGAHLSNRAEHTLVDVDLDLFVARFSVQFVFIAALDAGLADVRGSGIAAFVEFLHVRHVDAPDVADHMREFFAQRIRAREIRHDVHAVELPALRGESRDFVFG